MAEIKMVVGLGNPGDRYIDTRHNIGFKVIDSLAELLKIKVSRGKFGACFGQGQIADKKLILLKPQQFMNRSGQAVVTAVGFYKIAESDLLVISDDMALEPGRIRIRQKGSAGGHNGLADVIEKLGTEDISRLRIGIGQSDYIDDYDYVLGKPTEKEKPLINEAIDKAKQAVICWVEYGIEKVMNSYNQKTEQ